MFKVDHDRLEKTVKNIANIDKDRDRVTAIGKLASSLIRTPGYLIASQLQQFYDAGQRSQNPIDQMRAYLSVVIMVQSGSIDAKKLSEAA
jgi:hypothetical protein